MQGCHCELAKEFIALVTAPFPYINFCNRADREHAEHLKCMHITFINQTLKSLLVLSEIIYPSQFKAFCINRKNTGYAPILIIFL